MKETYSKNKLNLMRKIVSLCKRRGFIYPSSEIYGGFSSCYDFGPLGVEMENNIKKVWWNEMTKMHDNILGLDSAILMSPKVWQASGHLTAGFADELVECKACHHRFKKDALEEDKPSHQKIGSEGKCPDCGGNLTKPRKFNLMMKTFIGSVEDKASTAYLRPETCQGMYVNFENVLNSMRSKIPFGLVQIGKAFRNEITPGNFIFRTREFEQMEMQWFCNPKDANRYFDYWKEQRIKWYLSLGVKKDNLRASEIPKKERAHYAKKQIDLEYRFPFGWQELEGIHNRGDFDLSNHAKNSGKDLRYLDKETGKKYFPYIIETSAGVGRSFLAFLCNAYQEVKGGRTETTKTTKEKELVLKLDKRLAPVKVAVFPLIKKDKKLIKLAKDIYKEVKKELVAQYDEVDSVGRRYRRQDEIGTPYCITVDFDSLKDKKVTIRDRDSMKQERVKIDKLLDTLRNKLKN
jgi:glycyl-tRNA synthetase